MNVLFIYYVPSGGVETLNRERSRALKKVNIQSHFLYYEKRRELINDHEAPVYITRDDDKIRNIIENGNYTAIVVTSDFPALPKIRSFGYQGEIIVEIQGYGPKETARRLFKKFAPYVEKYVDGLLNPKTPYIAQLFREIFPGVPSFHFNNCFDTKKFSYVPVPKPEHPIIAWIGRIVANKNWSEFLKIGARFINEHNPNIQLMMFEDPTISDARERKKFHTLVRELQLEKKILRHTNLPHKQMARMFSLIGESGGFLCSTSEAEGAPYSVLEALICRCPVLTTDSDGVKSMIIHNSTGKYYTLGNIQEAVTEGMELMTNKRLREQIRDNGVRHVEQQFSPEKYADHFLEMLRQIGAVN